jgi:hypothetical protein
MGGRLDLTPGLDTVTREIPSPWRDSNPDHPLVQPVVCRYTVPRSTPAEYRTTESISVLAFHIAQQIFHYFWPKKLTSFEPIFNSKTNLEDTEIDISIRQVLLMGWLNWTWSLCGLFDVSNESSDSITRKFLDYLKKNSCIILHLIKAIILMSILRSCSENTNRSSSLIMFRLSCSKQNALCVLTLCRNSTLSRYYIYRK